MNAPHVLRKKVLASLVNIDARTVELREEISHTFFV